MRGTQPLDEVLAETLVVVDVPVLAAGGVGTADRCAELLEAGAAGVRVGTRFVAAEESDAHPDYVALLIEASSQDTMLTEAFATGWPDAPHRVLRSSIEAAEAFDGTLVATVGGRDVGPFSPRSATRDVQGEIGAMALYAGQSVDHVKRVQPAAEIVAELTAKLSSFRASGSRSNHHPAVAGEGVVISTGSSELPGSLLERRCSLYLDRERQRA
jgi:nitronate monooxygenase